VHRRNHLHRVPPDLRKDHALSRRFQKVDVVEPSVNETIEILKGLKSRFEEHHGIKYSASALSSAAELSARYINDRHLPDKAIDVIDEAGAAQRILPKSRQKKLIGKTEIEEIVAKIARIPPRNVSNDDKAALKTLDRDLKNVVFGQDAAIEALAKAIKMSRSGLGNPQKPIGAFLFSGPTGVGKTEVARQLAYTLGIELVRFDMSEYMERHAVSRLIGAPPGYVGFDQGGLLTEQVNKKPHCVLLLDEIEKAHPDIYNILLQVMDHGTLTDNNGRQADFRNTILIMTTNAGAEAMQKSVMGFSAKREAGDEMAEIKRQFSPEFRNRLDATISFSALDPEIIMRVVDKFLMQLEAQLHEKKVEALFTDKLKEWLGKKGFDPLMGARPMARLIQDTIRSALADELLFGRLSGAAASPSTWTTTARSAAVRRGRGSYGIVPAVSHVMTAGGHEAARFFAISRSKPWISRPPTSATPTKARFAPSPRCSAASAASSALPARSAPSRFSRTTPWCAAPSRARARQRAGGRRRRLDALRDGRRPARPAGRQERLGRHRRVWLHPRLRPDRGHGARRLRPRHPPHEEHQEGRRRPGHPRHLRRRDLHPGQLAVRRRRRRDRFRGAAAVNLRVTTRRNDFLFHQTQRYFTIQN
jgi:MoxR-like ATPase